MGFKNYYFARDLSFDDYPTPLICKPWDQELADAMLPKKVQHLARRIHWECYDPQDYTHCVGPLVSWLVAFMTAMTLIAIQAPLLAWIIWGAAFTLLALLPLLFLKRRQADNKLIQAYFNKLGCCRVNNYFVQLPNTVWSISEGNPSLELEDARRRVLYDAACIARDLDQPHLPEAARDALTAEAEHLMKLDRELMQAQAQPLYSAASKRALLEAHVVTEEPELPEGYYALYPHQPELEAA